MKDSSHQNTDVNYLLNGLNNILSEDEIQFIKSNTSEICFSAGEAILRQGSFISQICYLKKGVVKKVLEGKNDRNTIVKLVEDKHFLALPVLGNHDQYPFSIYTVTDCEVCFIKKEAMYVVVQENQNANTFILEWYANDYNYIYNKMATISTRNSHGKLATTLLYLTNGHFTSDVLNAISRKELAELSSISKESVKKILQQLNHDGLIAINKDEIIIKRRDLLEYLSTVG